MESLEKRVANLQRKVKGKDKKAEAQLAVAKKLLEHLENNNPASSFENKDEVFNELIKEIRLLSAKEIIYGANVASKWSS